jgi:outer membrane usher protein FimD/PapC
VLVSYNNEPMGRTDADGELLVPELRSQLQNRLSIEPRQVPFGYRIGETAHSVTVPFRGGGLVDFGVTRLRAYEGRLVVVDEAGARPAEYGRLDLERDGETLHFPLGSGGALYLEGVEPGTYPARILHEGSVCSLRLELPDRRDPSTDIGEILCTHARSRRDVSRPG